MLLFCVTEFSNNVEPLNNNKTIVFLRLYVTKKKSQNFTKVLFLVANLQGETVGSCCRAVKIVVFTAKLSLFLSRGLIQQII